MNQYIYKESPVAITRVYRATKRHMPGSDVFVIFCGPNDRLNPIDCISMSASAIIFRALLITSSFCIGRKLNHGNHRIFIVSEID